jgi:hypothetical protein
MISGLAGSQVSLGDFSRVGSTFGGHSMRIHVDAHFNHSRLYKWCPPVACMAWTLSISISISILFLILSTPYAASAEDRPDYLRHVKPLLAEKCFSCHGALKQEGGLRLDTARLAREGGDSGPAAIPHDVAGSELIARITSTEESLRMPLEAGPLSDLEVRLLKSWIEQGAEGLKDEQPELDPADHWAFQTPERPLVPDFGGSREYAAWIRNPIDAFIAAQHQRHGLFPQLPADKRLLLRRVYLDLIGLPPTMEQLDAFVADPAPDAYEQAVDKLLKSPQYAERWGRHWMDIWRYSDWWGLGAEVRNSQKHIWHWRDWIIKSLREDVGYDEMLRQMLAADELYPEDLDKLRATGYLARQYFKFNRNTWLDETVEHTAKAFLGVTMNCCKCHDHKYDPFGHEDYYRFRAFFEPYQVRMDQLPGELDYEQNAVPRAFDCNLETPTYLFVRGDEKQPRTTAPLAPGLPEILHKPELVIEPVELPPVAHHPGLRAWVLQNHLQQAAGEVRKAEQQLKEARRTFDQLADETEVSAPDRAALLHAEKNLAVAQLKAPAFEARAAADRARFLGDLESSAESHAQEAALAERRLELAMAEAEVARLELELLRSAEDKRAELEKQLTSAREGKAKAEQSLAEPGERYTPLRGALKTIESTVETEENRLKPFPTVSTGRRRALAQWITSPENPLTARVAVNHIWTRHFNQPLVPTTFDFGRKGTPPAHPELLDWLAVELMDNGWSMRHLHRLIVTSATYRLSSSNLHAELQFERDPENRWYWRMNPHRMEAQVVRDSLLYLADELDTTFGGPPVNPVADEQSRRRGLYFVHSHNDHHRFLEIFDDAGVQECYRRDQSIVPQQSLALANSRQAFEAARAVTARLERPGDLAGDTDFIRAVFLTLLANEPTDEELRVCREALVAWREAKSRGDSAGSERRARVNLVHALLNHNDFITIR